MSAVWKKARIAMWGIVLRAASAPKEGRVEKVGFYKAEGCASCLDLLLAEDLGSEDGVLA